MPDVRPLPIFGAISDADLANIRQAKLEINPPYLLKIVEAFPDSPGRVLALRQRPPYNCEHDLVAKDEGYERLRLALYWVLHPEFDHPGAHLVTDPLYAVFGPNLKEIHDGPHFE
jgi:hypothetical protein